MRTSSNLQRAAAVILATGLGALTLTACTSESSAEPPSGTEGCSPEGVTLAVSHPATAQESIDLAIASFEAANPGLTVESSVLAGSSYVEYAQQVIGDLAAGVAVDVVNIGNDQVRLFTDSYDVRPFELELLADTYDSQFLPAGQVNGVQYAIPYLVSVPSLYINRDALAAAGIDPDIEMTSTDDLLEVGAEISALTGRPSLGIYTSDAWFLQMLTESFGGDFLDDGRPTFDSPEGARAFEFYATGARTGALYRTMASDLMGDFVTGDLAIAIVSTAAVPTIDQQIDGAFDWGLMLFPSSPDPVYALGGNSWISLAEDDCMAAFGQSFIAELVSAEALVPALNSTSYFPVDSAARAALLDDPELDPRTRMVYEAQLDLVPFGGWPGTSTPEVYQTLSDTMDRLMAGSDPAVELEEAFTAIEKIVG